MKKNFYLQHSLMAFNDPRMKTLIEEEGLEGFGAYWFIVEKLELLPEPCAKLDYLQPFCTPQISLLYLGEIIGKYQLFIIDEEGYFTPDELNPSRLKSHKNTEKEQEIAQNQAKNAQNAALFQQNLHFLVQKTMKNAKKRNAKNKVKKQKNSILTQKDALNTKEKIKDKIITTTAEEKEVTAAAAVVDFSSEIPVGHKPTPPTSPARSWSQMADDLVQEEPWLQLTCEQSGYAPLLRRHVKKAIELFKRHIVLYNKGEKLKTKQEVCIYFVNFISAGSRTSMRLRAALQEWDNAINATHTRNDCYRYEQRIDGQRTYMGCPIPDYAPPRPSETAIWNDLTRTWTSSAKSPGKSPEKPAHCYLQ